MMCDKRIKKTNIGKTCPQAIHKQAFHRALKCNEKFANNLIIDSIHDMCYDL